MKTTLISSAAAAPFAHLLGGLARKPRAARAEDETDKKDDEARSGRAEDTDDSDKKDDEAKKGRRAEDSDDTEKKDDEARADEKDPEDPDRDDPVAGKKGRTAADDDEYCAEEEDDDEDVAAAARAGRKAERARCAKIFNSKAAGVRPDVAAQLAFGTRLSSAEAIGVLEATVAGAPALAAAAPSRLHDRMARMALPSLGSDAPEVAREGGPAATAKAIVSAANKARGRKA